MQERAPLVYLVIALPAAIAFAFLSPPMQTPDEVGHYWRSTAIAHGDLISPKHEGKPSSMISGSSRELVGTVWMEMAGRPVKFETGRLRRAWELRHNPERIRVHFPAFYTAVPYLPQSTALLIGRVFGLRPLAAFYLGRVFNAITGVLLVMFAMHLLPQARWAFAIIGLTPMFLYLAGSFSADVFTIGIAFCTTACALKREATPRFVVLSLLLGLCKPAYVLLPLLVLPLIAVRRARPVLAAAAAALAIGIAASAWTARTSSFAMRPDLLANPSAQLAHAAGYPLRVAKAIAVNYAGHAYQYLDHFVGRLGWLDIGLPRFVLWMYLAAFVYVALSMSLKLSPRDRLLALLVVAGSLFLVSFSQYLIWTPVASDSVDGIQGRYFLPIGPLVLIALGTKRLRERWWAPVAVALIGNATAIVTLYRHYY